MRLPPSTVTLDIKLDNVTDAGKALADACKALAEDPSIERANKLTQQLRTAGYAIQQIRRHIIENPGK